MSERATARSAALDHGEGDVDRARRNRTACAFAEREHAVLGEFLGDVKVFQVRACAACCVRKGPSVAGV
jgi:hypothetical protein